MEQVNRRLDFVDVLAAGAAGPGCRNLKVLQAKAAKDFEDRPMQVVTISMATRESLLASIPLGLG